MTSRLRGRVLAGAVVVPLLLTATACEKDKNASNKRAEQACGAEVSQTASTPLPADLPVVEGVAYRYDAQGKTRFWYVAVPGAGADVVSIRDRAKEALTAKGYTIKGSDQEPGVEAEAEFAGPHDGTIQVRTLCSGKDVIRYKLES